MVTLTFEQLPEAISQISEKVNAIERLLLEGSTPQAEGDELMLIGEAALFLKLTVPTIYSKVSRGEIPVNKRGNRLYFYRSELTDWIKGGRRKTHSEIRQDLQERRSSGNGRI